MHMKTKFVRGALPTMTLLLALSGLYGCGGDEAPPPPAAASTAPAGAAPAPAAPADAGSEASASTAATAPQSVPALLEEAFGMDLAKADRALLPQAVRLGEGGTEFVGISFRRAAG